MTTVNEMNALLYERQRARTALEAEAEKTVDSEVNPRLVGAQKLLAAALDGSLDPGIAIDGALRLLAHAEDFLPRDGV